MHRETTDPEASCRVAILAPMPSELRPLRAPLRLAAEPEAPFLRGAIGRIDVVAALTGVGMGAAARCATRVLEEQSPHHVIVVGIAGGIGADVAVGDLIVPERVLDLAGGATLLPTPLGDRAPRGTLASSNELLTPAEAKRLGEKGVVAVDMETAAIGTVCEQRGCRWSVFRGVSDRADDGSTDPAVLGLVDDDGKPKPAAVLRFLLTRPQRIPQLIRLGRGANAAARTASNAVLSALASL